MPSEITIHKEIRYHLFANLEKIVNKNKLSQITGYNWRTIKRHLEMMSLDYKNRVNTKKGGKK